MKIHIMCYPNTSSYMAEILKYFVLTTLTEGKEVVRFSFPLATSWRSLLTVNDRGEVKRRVIHTCCCNHSDSTFLLIPQLFNVCVCVCGGGGGGGGGRGNNQIALGAPSLC